MYKSTATHCRQHISWRCEHGTRCFFSALASPRSTNLMPATPTTLNERAPTLAYQELGRELRGLLRDDAEPDQPLRRARGPESGERAWSCAQNETENCFVIHKSIPRSPPYLLVYGGTPRPHAPRTPLLFEFSTSLYFKRVLYEVYVPPPPYP